MKPLQITTALTKISNWTRNKRSTFITAVKDDKLLFLKLKNRGCKKYLHYFQGWNWGYTRVYARIPKEIPGYTRVYLKKFWSFFLTKKVKMFHKIIDYYGSTGSTYNNSRTVNSRTVNSRTSNSRTVNSRAQIFSALNFLKLILKN